MEKKRHVRFFIVDSMLFSPFFFFTPPESTFRRRAYIHHPARPKLQAHLHTDRPYMLIGFVSPRRELYYEQPHKTRKIIQKSLHFGFPIFFFLLPSSSDVRINNATPLSWT
ncbi:hypothetical protein OUZ56_002726 [Daphnia magna]|uniref:Uncharacterized protein n=1 Tax=Daphnia magna TaxID=35525 RepID=A0ABR0A6K1_9CRUS|nr:hypothetical protein OUZ56_002726 [Daphnia magna]